MKSRVRIVTIISFVTVIISILTYLGYHYIPQLFPDETWIKDFGYEKNQIYKLTFNWPGDRSCPEIPIEIGDTSYQFGFDTGCGTGIFFTNVIENQINYTLIGEMESLNRDGSHRGWSKNIIIDEFTVFGDTFKNIETTISDWTLYSSEEFNGTIGLDYFKSKIITLDYTGHKIAVSNKPIDYDNLSSEYVILPLHKTSSRGQESLPFFEAESSGKPFMVYLDTGKNHSYVYNQDSKYSMNDREGEYVDIPIKIGTLEIMLDDLVEINDVAQAEGLPYPTMIELNSDQIWKCDLLVTFDLIEQNIIFKRVLK